MVGDVEALTILEVSSCFCLGKVEENKRESPLTQELNFEGPGHCFFSLFCLFFVLWSHLELFFVSFCVLWSHPEVIFCCMGVQLHILASMGAPNPATHVERGSPSRFPPLLGSVFGLLFGTF